MQLCDSILQVTQRVQPTCITVCTIPSRSPSTAGHLAPASTVCCLKSNQTGKKIEKKTLVLIILVFVFNHWNVHARLNETPKVIRACVFYDRSWKLHHECNMYNTEFTYHCCRGRRLPVGVWLASSSTNTWPCPTTHSTLARRREKNNIVQWIVTLVK